MSFTKGYARSLKKWHGMMIRPIFYVSRRGFTQAYRGSMGSHLLGDSPP